MKENKNLKEENKNDSNLNNLNNIKKEEEDEIILGKFEQIPKYFRHNESIKTGYRLNCNTLSKAFKSLFILHNESVNIWSHLFGAIFFIFLIWYTTIFITNYKTLFKDIKQSLYNIEKDYLNLPSKINDTIFNNLINNFISFKNDFVYLKSNVNKIYISSFITLNETYSKINKISHNLQNFYNSFKPKFIELREKFLDLMELENITLGKNEQNILDPLRPSKKLRTWPLFIFLISAIICLSFSSFFHLTGQISTNFHRILSRFDYGGVCLLITGSCYPPYYYFYYCEPKYRIFYLTFMTTFGLSTFGLCLTNGFNLPDKRILRGSAFLTFGICSGIPILQVICMGDRINGYNTETRFLFWYLGSIIYVIGAVLYLFRFPERYFPGKFDIFGSSHQLLHIAVLIAVFCHYIGCLDAYYSRFGKICDLNN